MQFSQKPNRRNQLNIHNVTQGSPEWLAARLGKATASEFAKILTPGGKLSAQADAYARKIARECVIDEPEELRALPSKAMQWGTAKEPEAREAYMLATGHSVATVGFITHDTRGCLGCSPDGLCLNEFDTFWSGLEIKCPSIDTLTEWLLAKDKDDSFVPSEYLPQIHGSMIVCNLRRWDFCGYFPPLLDEFGKVKHRVPMVISTVTWNTYTDKLQAAMFEFADRYRVIAPDVWRVLGKGES
jgi:hypothetical protein